MIPTVWVLVISLSQMPTTSIVVLPERYATKAQCEVSREYAIKSGASRLSVCIEVLKP